MTNQHVLNQPLVLQNGVVINNRLCKAAMGEDLAKKGKITPQLIQLYEAWGKSGAGLLITGNVMVNKNAMGGKGAMCIEDESDIQALKKMANAAQKNGAQLWMQINHPGRQATTSINKETYAPSVVPLKPKAVFGIPKELTHNEILEIITRFGKTALVAKKAGFKGVQIHGAHGYLISQFLSGLTNKRIDEWGGSFKKRTRFVLEVYREIRKNVGKEYPVSIKINSADFQRGGFTEEESIKVIKLLSKEGIDLIEVSGGNYEKASMVGQELKESTKKREAYFSDFIIKARQATETTLMLTGGFRSVQAMADSLRENELDIIGMGRPFARNPIVAEELIEGKIASYPIPKIKTGVKMIDKKGFLDITWHTHQIKRIGNGKQPNLKVSGWFILRKMIKESIFSRK